MRANFLVPVPLSFGLLFACVGGEEKESTPPVFGGEGAVVAKEQPLPPATPGETDSGPCKGPAPAGDTALFDDFEDNDNKAFKGFEREGWWWSATDPTPDAKIMPAAGTFAPERLPTGEGTKDNLFAAHFTAEGQKEWGVSWGSTLAWTNGGIKCPFNASLFAGVTFRAKGKGQMRFTLGQPETVGADGGGKCKERCYDTYGKIVFLTPEWQEFSVPWDKLQQEGWGTQVRFDPARLINLTFSARVKEVPADFWVDDVVFMKTGAAAKAP
ncbi:MAG TPA: hypothetical protein VF103_15890 [Polyangiaceae bacterium]